MNKRILVICIFFIFFISNNASAANLIQNGGFETGSYSNWSNSGTGSYSGCAVIDSPDEGVMEIPVPPWEIPYSYGDPYYHSKMWAHTCSCFSFIRQTNLDFTSIETLKYEIVDGSTLSGGADFKINVGVNGVSKYCIYTTESISSGVKELNMSSYQASGYDYIEFYLKNANAGQSGSIRLDNILTEGEPPTINIDTKTTHLGTPLTGIIVNDENNTGGFPNEYGYRYLTPNQKDSKEYIVYLSGGDLQGGFKLTISANSADVTKLTININNLATSRIYNIRLDDTRVDTISSTTTYQYDITSFSIHTLEVKDVTPPPDTMPSPFPLCSGVVCSPHCEGTTYYYNGRCIDGACVYDSQANHDNCVGESEYEEYDDEDKKLSGEHYSIGRFGVTIPDLSESPFLEVILFMFISFIVVAYAVEKR